MSTILTFRLMNGENECKDNAKKMQVFRYVLQKSIIYIKIELYMIIVSNPLSVNDVMKVSLNIF